MAKRGRSAAFMAKIRKLRGKGKHSKHHKKVHRRRISKVHNYLGHVYK